MNYEALFGVLVWLAVGWVFTIWFVNYFLDDRRWTDGQEIGPGSMLMLNIFGPAMLVVMVTMLVLFFVLDNSGDTIRRLYRVKAKDL